MPNGSFIDGFAFPALSNGATRLWSISGVMHIDGGNSFHRTWGNDWRGFDGNPGNLDEGSDRQLPPTWPGRNSIVSEFAVYPDANSVNTGYSARLGFVSSEEESADILRVISNWWLVFRLRVGVANRAFQYRIGSATYPRVVSYVSYTSQFVIPSFVYYTEPVFIWRNVSAEMYAAAPTAQRPTFALAIYAATEGVEPLFTPAVTHNFTTGAVTLPAPSSTATTITPQVSGSLVATSTIPAPSSFTSGLRPAAIREVEFPVSVIRGIQSIRFGDEHRVDSVDSEDNSQRVSFIHPGHRKLITLQMRFRNEGEYLAFGSIINSIGEAGVLRLPLSQVQNLIPQGSSTNAPFTITERAESGATTLQLDTTAPFPSGITAGQMVQPATARKVYTIVGIDETARQIEIEPGLITPLPPGSQVNTGSAVVYYLQPQGGTQTWMKSYESPNIVTATYKFREFI